MNPPPSIDKRKIRNLGPVSRGWLATAGIHTLGHLREVSVVNAYNLVRAHGHRATLSLLWAMQGALMDVQWSKVPSNIKRDLLQRLESR